MLSYLGTPSPGQGTPPPAGPGRVPPPPLPHGILGNVAKHYGIRVPPPRCGLTNKVKLLPSRRTTYAGGNESFEIVSVRARSLPCQVLWLTLTICVVVLFGLYYRNALAEFMTSHNANAQYCSGLFFFFFGQRQ